MSWRIAICGALWGCLAAGSILCGDEYFFLKKNGTEVQVRGRVIVEAEDGGALIEDRAGRLWAAESDQIVKREKDQVPFARLDADKMAEAVLDQLPDGFDVHKTAHYLICYNTSPAYARWCGGLFERLYRAFNNFWDRQGMTLSEPAGLLVAIIFSDERTYREYAVVELGESVHSIVGYYNLMTNRVVMYDLTGAQKIRQAKDRVRQSVEINRVLSRPEAASLVATIIHEATHQIAFNCGMQTRLADVPIWVSEGIAMYFETPDLKSSRGWRGLGAVNRTRLKRFHSPNRSRPADSIRVLLSDDRWIQGRAEDPRFQGREAVLDAYAEAWCLAYYLIKHHPDEFVKYMQLLAEKRPLQQDTAEQRVADFERFFGTLPGLEQKFLRQMSRVR
ncbi:MAG: DUF1570 domain-containing protein [Planctomycetales bacterium]|nr:DUF1570 domain-containing protein [Planctomycetales bacterium]NIM08547.1 DUF1570 domain-containing protein [Planctomycetales bacterium]NIN08018.1 DUF1570 domain-containing protein [Planctomycetales bacterium]NIN77147.1 DUF1570 domain-containing protein [Planctomycetales bacterium]NIO34331.1 DUF1570 domain-containing protein [Planctomycetales bacterium]